MDTMSHRRAGSARLMAGLGIGAAVLIAAAGCSSGGSKSTSAAGATTSGNQVTVTDTEFHQAFSAMSFTPGKWTFNTVNAGKTVHALEIDGPGVHAVTPDIQPGQSAPITVTLQAGQYDVFCPVPGHKALGMNTEITVGSTGGAAPAATTPAAPTTTPAAPTTTPAAPTTTPAAPAPTTAPTTAPASTTAPTTATTAPAGSVSY